MTAPGARAPATATIGDAAALVRLMTWLSPSFPTGAFAFSHGLERASHDGLVAARPDLEAWLSDLLTIGSLWNDAIICAEAMRRAAEPQAEPQADTEADLAELSDLASALAGSRQRLAETLDQGTAFVAAARHWPSPVLGRLPDPCALPVAFGAVAAAHSIAPEPALAAYLNAAAGNLVQAAIRLSVVGQADAVAVTAGLEPVVLDTAARASRAGLDDLGSATFAADIAALKHETQYSRLFRS